MLKRRLNETHPGWYWIVGGLGAVPECLKAINYYKFESLEDLTSQYEVCFLFSSERDQPKCRYLTLWFAPRGRSTEVHELHFPTSRLMPTPKAFAPVDWIGIVCVRTDTMVSPEILETKPKDSLVVLQNDVTFSFSSPVSETTGRPYFVINPPPNGGPTEISCSVHGGSDRYIECLTAHDLQVGKWFWQCRTPEAEGGTDLPLQSDEQEIDCLEM